MFVYCDFYVITLSHKVITELRKAMNLEKIRKRWSNNKNDESRGNLTADEGRP